MQRRSPIFDYLPHLEYLGTKGNRIRIPFALPQIRRCRTMAHAELIANTIRQDIQDYRVQSFDNFGVEIHIHPVPAAFELYDIKGRWVGFNKYIFEAWGEEAKEMCVTVDHAWNVKIHYLGEWRPVSAYLDNLKRHNAWDGSDSRRDIMHLKWQHQADWWRDNGKVFPLIGLPAEIREKVYEHVWGAFIEPYPTNKCRGLTKLEKQKKKSRMPNVNLLRTSQIVAAEAGNILFLRKSFCIEHYGVLKALTSRVEQRVLIRHIELAFSHQEFMHLFSTDHVRRDRKTKTEEIGFGYPALALRSMKLSSLRLVVAPPSLTTGNDKFDGACQRVAVDMIMDAAWPIIRGHPFELVGYVKKSQKDIYEARDVLERQRLRSWQKKRVAFGLPEGTLAEYDDELDEEVGGVPLDGSRPELALEESATPDYDLTCKCDPPCTEETWASE